MILWKIFRYKSFLTLKYFKLNKEKFFFKNKIILFIKMLKQENKIQPKKESNESRADEILYKLRLLKY